MPKAPRHGQALRFERIQDLIASAAQQPRFDLACWELLVFIAEEQMYQSKHFGRVLSHIERMERHIMAADDAIFATLKSMGDDVGEMQAGIANLQAQLEAGNTQGAADEAAKISEALAPLAAQLRSAAATFDPSPPASVPTPEPGPAPTGPRAAFAARNKAIVENAKNHPAPKTK